MEREIVQQYVSDGYVVSSVDDETISKNSMKELELGTMEEIKNVLVKAQPFVLFSGGRDSVVTLDLTRKVAENLERDLIAIHADTTIGLFENLDYVRSACKLLGVKLVIVRPDFDFFELARRKGFPRHNARWCCYQLKVDPIGKYLRAVSGEKIILDGIRAEESRQRTKMSQYSWHKKFTCNVFHPIFYWKRTDVIEYLRRHNLPENPLYSKGFKRATECWCGVFKSVEEFKLLLRGYPEFFEKLVDLEASMRNGGSFLFKQGKKVYLRDLKEEEKILRSS